MLFRSACLDLVKRFEGYHKRLLDGGCEAYAEVINGKRDRWTIGWGCTRGVTEGMVWTEAEAELALVRELEIHAKRVDRLITIDLTTNERAALISFDFNCGGLTGNTLKAINSGDRHRAAEAMKQWNKFGGQVCKGLVSRRAAEIGLWLTPEEHVEPDYMPQELEKPGPSSIDLTKIAGAGTLGTGLTLTAANETLSEVKKIGRAHV